MHTSGRNRLIIIAAASAFTIALASAREAPAQFAQFQVDPGISSLTVSGTVIGATIQQQGPGSLTTTYFGSLFVDLSATTIAFPGGSEVTANNSGDWQPAPGGVPGSAPANYGGRVVVLLTNNLAAVRDAVFDITTLSPLPLTSSGTFSSAVDFTATSGVIDYTSPLAGNGSDTLVGNSGTNAAPNPGSLSIAPAPAPAPPGFAAATLTVPVSMTLITDVMGLGDAVFNFNGSVTAGATARGGDANFDAVVNLDDFNTLAANFGASSGASWLAADFNFDGRVNLDDFNILAANFGQTAAVGGPAPDDWTTLASAVPEPGTPLAVLAAGALALLQRRPARPLASPR